MAFDRDHDARLRAAVFSWLKDQVEQHSDVLPRSVLAAGMSFEGQRVPMLGPQGIFKPRLLDVPLSLTTSPNSPYNDRVGMDGKIHYSYRGRDPDHPDNRGVRLAMQLELPLVYFHGLVPGRYLVTWPVFVVGDDPGNLEFAIAADDTRHLRLNESIQGVRDQSDVFRREYITVLTLRRLHQKAFRERVLEAYRRECAFCRFRHEDLLDAAHIVGDREELGDPRTSNGLALCRLHHAVFDKDYVGIRPDLTLEVRPDILDEIDGPTLVHGIQALHNRRITIPRRLPDRPDISRLEIRYHRFREQSPRGLE